MKQRLFTEILPLYKSKNNNPYAIRIRMRMLDTVDYAALKDAVDTTMKRYPYFCVRLREECGEFVFEDNPSPVVLSDSMYGAKLNSKDSNYHMIAFSYYDDWIVMDVFHGLTDGTGTQTHPFGHAGRKSPHYCQSRYEGSSCCVRYGFCPYLCSCSHTCCSQGIHPAKIQDHSP